MRNTSGLSIWNLVDELCPELKIITHWRTGEIIAVHRCRRITCRPCAIFNARRAAGALWLSRPSLVFGISRAGRTAEEINTKMRRFEKLMKLYDLGCKFFWVVEPDLNGDGFAHIHGYMRFTRSRAFPAEVIKEAARQAEMGRTYVKKISRRNRDKPSYFGYYFKGLSDPDLYEEFLELNRSARGPQLGHTTRGFWRDEHGEHMNSREAAATRARTLIRAFKRSVP